MCLYQLRKCPRVRLCINTVGYILENSMFLRRLPLLTQGVCWRRHDSSPWCMEVPELVYGHVFGIPMWTYRLRSQQELSMCLLTYFRNQAALLRDLEFLENNHSSWAPSSLCQRALHVWTQTGSARHVYTWHIKTWQHKALTRHEKNWPDMARHGHKTQSNEQQHFIRKVKREEDAYLRHIKR